MRTSSLLCLGVAMVWSIPVQAQHSNVNYRITGVVVDTNTGAPIPHCHLTPSRVGYGRTAGRQFPGGPATGVDTDEHGHFMIAVPSAGMWRLTASASGYTTQAYEEHEGYSSAIVLTEQISVIDLRFRIAPEANLTGIVLDEAGEAVRNARVGLFSIPSQGPDNQPDAARPRSFTTTDDRGYYEFANLPQGSYRVAVDARPWYASPARTGTPDPSNSSSASLDPSLDVTYPQTWYPGVDDAGQAETLMLKPGDTTRADFHLLPVPAIQLRVIAPIGPVNAQGRSITYPPMVERVGAGGGMGFGGTPVVSTAQGQFDITGLSPGLYQIRLPGQNQESRVALVQVSQGGARTVDFTSGTSDESNITIHFDGNLEDENAIQVELVNADNGQRVTEANPRFAGGGRPGRGGARPQDQESHERIIEVPPGRYEVMLSGRPDVYLTGLSAKSAEVSGRFIKVHNGDASLTIHVGRGKASVTGIATIASKPVIGAMVMLIPAGLGDPRAITLLARDQTNTDGSFDLNDVVPGEYILIAIDNGWQINWKDASTLNHYLVNGVPLELQPGASMKQNVDAQAP